MYKTAVASETVTKGQCYLLMASMVSPSGTVGQIDIYDGQNTNGKLIAQLSAVAGGMAQFSFAGAETIHQGLFVNVVGAVLSWTVEFQ